MSETFVAATHNQGKIKEMNAITMKLGIQLIDRDSAGVPHEFDVDETGETFEENSYKKAYEIMKMTGLPALADDSGLQVDYLGGAPGVYSARYGGSDGNDGKNVDKLLDAMKDCPEGKRTAHFTTVITLVYPDGRKLVATGECYGRIATERHGDKGFGYDPVFIPDGYSETFAELGSEVKNVIGHRGRALVELASLLTK